MARLLAVRSLRRHRRAWAAVAAALALTSLLLGAFALALASAGLGHPRVERYAAAPVVVAGDQTTRYTTASWGGGTQTAQAALTERVRVPREAVDAVRAVPGVRAAVADVEFAVTVVRTGRERGNGDGGGAIPGRPWAAARLAPYGLLGGRPPQGPDEVAVSAGAGVRLGERVRLRAGGDSATYRVVGEVAGPAAVYAAERTARRLAGHPGSVAAVAVLADPGVRTGDLAARVRAALDRAGLRDTAADRRAAGDSGTLRVLTGDDRGAAEHLDAAPARTGLLAALAAVAGVLGLVAPLVVASLVAQALDQRSAELALLRTVGAAPRQLRRVVGLEVVRVAVPSALAGAVAAVPVFLLLRHGAGRVLPSGLVLPAPPWLLAAPLAAAAVTVGAAWLAALLGSARATGARGRGRRGGRAGRGERAGRRERGGRREAEGHGERAGRGKPGGHGGGGGQGRRTGGLVLLVVGIASAGTAAAQSGQAAAGAAGAAAVTMATGCALLGPWIASGAMRLLGGPLRRIGPAGRLAAAECAAHSRRLGAAITPVVLLTAFVLVQLGGAATVRHAGDVQAAAAVRADHAVTGVGADSVRRVPGVAAAAYTLPTTVVLARKELGDPVLERLPVLGVSPDGLARTLSPGVTDGGLGGLRPGTVAVGADRASSLGVHVGSTVALRFGDGVERELRVVAVYERSLALGDFLLSADEVARHVTAPDAGRTLVAERAGAAPGAVRAALERLGGDVADGPVLARVRTDDEAVGGAVALAAVVAIGGFTGIAVLSTLALIVAGRRGELSLLRRVGASRRQVRRMLGAEAAVVAVAGLVLGTAVAAVPLLAFGRAAARALPYLPPAQGAALAAGVVVTVFAGMLVPGRRAR